jgi:hypothetical protein
MNLNELTIAIGGGLFAAFLLGWIAGWMTLRASGPAAAPLADEAEAGRAHAARAEEDAAAAREQLRQAQVEIEELRAYIAQRLRPPPGEAP